MSNLRQGGFLISKIHQMAGRIFAKKLKEYNICEINPAQGRILFALWQNDNIPIQELAKKTALSKSTLTRMLDRLESSGHIVRVFPPDDRRKILIRLTEEDKRIKAAYEEVSLAMIDLFYKNFTEDEIDRFETSLLKILNNLSNYQ